MKIIFHFSYTRYAATSLQQLLFVCMLIFSCTAHTSSSLQQLLEQFEHNMLKTPLPKKLTFEQAQETIKRAIQYSDGTTLWNLEQQLKAQFPDMPPLWVDFRLNTNFGYVPPKKRTNTPNTICFCPTENEIIDQPISHTIRVPLIQSLQMDVHATRAALIHEIGHSTKPYQAEKNELYSAYASCAVFFIAPLFCYQKTDSTAASLGCALAGQVTAKKIALHITHNLEERRADNFMCQHADQTALQAQYDYLKKLVTNDQSFYTSHWLSQYLSVSIAPNFLMYALHSHACKSSALSHPSYQSRMEKIEAEINRRNALKPTEVNTAERRFRLLPTAHHEFPILPHCLYPERK